MPNEPTAADSRKRVDESRQKAEAAKNEIDKAIC
jgi:hypothetical protein